METLLFDSEKVKKFFDILSRLNRHQEERYKGYDKNNPNFTPCEKEVFVKRTIKKWYSGKYFVWYRKSEQTGVYYKCFVSVSNIMFYLGYGDEIEVYYYDYSSPANIWNTLKLSHNDIIDLEGEHSNGVIHNELLKIFVLDIPEKEYTFKAYDWNKYPKRKKKGWTDKDVYKSMETTISFKAKTRSDAYKLKSRFEKEQSETRATNLIIVPEIININ
jgi:hypothetical protein